MHETNGCNLATLGFLKYMKTLLETKQHLEEKYKGINTGVDFSVEEQRRESYAKGGSAIRQIWAINSTLDELRRQLTLMTAEIQTDIASLVRDQNYDQAVKAAQVSGWILNQIHSDRGFQWNELLEKVEILDSHKRYRERVVVIEKGVFRYLENYCSQHNVKNPTDRSK